MALRDKFLGFVDAELARQNYDESVSAILSDANQLLKKAGSTLNFGLSNQSITLFSKGLDTTEVCNYGFDANTKRVSISTGIMPNAKKTFYQNASIEEAADILETLIKRALPRADHDLVVAYLTREAATAARLQRERDAGSADRPTDPS